MTRLQVEAHVRAFRGEPGLGLLLAAAAATVLLTLAALHAVWLVTGGAG